MDKLYGIPTLTWLIAAGVMYLLLCLRIALHARRLGRNAIAWFFITLFFTALPAMILFIRSSIQAQKKNSGQTASPDSGKVTRCRHCGHILAGSKPAAVGGVKTCPGCNMILDEEIRA